MFTKRTKVLPSILNVNNFHYIRGGSDTYFFELFRLLNRKGHKVGDFSTLSKNNIEVDRIVADGPRLQDDNRLSLLNPFRFFYSIDAANKLDYVISKFNPDIVHVHTYYGRLTPSILGTIQRKKKPVVQTLHEFKIVCPTLLLYSRDGFCDKCQGQHYWRALSERCNKGSFIRTAVSVIESYISRLLGDRHKIDRFIAVSEYQKKQLIRLGVPVHKITVVYNFVTINKEPPIKQGEYFLYVGRLIKEKGVGDILHAYSKLRHPKPNLLIVGAGRDELDLKSLAEDLGILEKVEFLGHKDSTELHDLYNGCICTIAPSHLNETFGLTAAESLAHGKPVIASNIGALPEIVKDRETGILVSPGDINGLTNALNMIMNDLDRASEMGKKGWLDVKQRFSEDAHYENILAIYTELLQGH